MVYKDKVKMVSNFNLAFNRQGRTSAVVHQCSFFLWSSYALDNFKIVILPSYKMSDRYLRQVGNGSSKGP